MTWARMAKIAANWLPKASHSSSLAVSEVRRQTPEVGAVCGNSARTVLCGGCVKKARKRHAVRKMEVDPSKSLCRRRLQTAMSCFGQKPRW